ncbi:heparinase II/III domain-containing protein [Lactiplantibacillus carotarum]|uniref:heparinase II/III domain-containing protein n=1 Tax=Lactiplantibacillus carotarum TaxID=2993456 RepID=UPI00298F2174|nr:heparinase II/III family protein [Lactiplantibacillus carotarum]
MNKLRAIYRYVPQVVRPNGFTLLQGDSDRMAIDELYSLTAGMGHLPLPTNNIFTFRLDSVVLELRHQIPTITMVPADYLSTWYPSATSGNYFWRSSWQADADYGHAYNGNLGSGHGHAALGHLDLTLAGRDVLVDSGRYTYVDSHERRWLKSVYAHNVVVIDDQPFSMPKDAWKYRTVATPLSNQTYHDQRYTVVSMVYQDANRAVPVTVNRWCVWDAQQRTLVIFDGLLTAGKHRVQRLWHLAPDLTAHATTANRVDFTGSAHFAGQLSFSDQVQSTVATLYSDRYNARGTTTCVTTASDFMDQTVLATVITDQPAAQIAPTKIVQSDNVDATVSPDHAFGVTVTVGATQTTYLRQLRNTFVGNKMYYANGQPFYGNLCTMTQTDGQTQYQRLW